MRPRSHKHYFQCWDCHRDTKKLREIYYLRPPVWVEIIKGIDPEASVLLCIGCAEKRLGRRLRPKDFNDLYPINWDLSKQSKRLRDRVGAKSKHEAILNFMANLTRVHRDQIADMVKRYLDGIPLSPRTQRILDDGCRHLEQRGKALAVAEREAAEAGNADGQCALAIAYEFGIRVAKNRATAVKWYRKAAEQGHAEAQCRLASCYDAGAGVAKNPAAAVKWWRKAAKQAHLTAQFSLAVAYATGKGVRESLTVSHRWYRKAAAGGQVDAQYLLGLRYLHGIGIAQDESEAMKWLQKAADRGHTRAENWIAKIRGCR